MAENEEVYSSKVESEVKEEAVDTEVDEMVANSVAEEVASEKPKKGPSCSGCAIASAVFLVALFIILALIGFFIIKGSTEKEDLGIEGSVGGFEDFIEKTGIKTEVEYSDLCFDCPELTYKGQKEAKVIITQEDASSWVATVNANSYGLKGTQIKFTDDGVVLSTYVSYNGQEYPIYASGDIERAADKELDITVGELKVGKLSIPDNYKGVAEEWLEKLAKEKLEEAEGLTVKKLTISEGEVLFEGTLPEEIAY